MKNIKYLQICIKAFRVITYILTVIMIALAIVSAVFLAVWISYDDISFIYRSDFYQQILALTDVGAYYYNVAFYSSELIFYVIKATLLIYLIQLFNALIREENLFNDNISKLSRWMGIRVLVFPLIGFGFATFINIYLNQGIPVQLIDISFLIYGAFFIFLSILLKCGTVEKTLNCEENCEAHSVSELHSDDIIVETDEPSKEA